MREVIDLVKFKYSEILIEQMFDRKKILFENTLPNDAVDLVENILSAHIDREILKDIVILVNKERTRE